MKCQHLHVLHIIRVTIFFQKLSLIHHSVLGFSRDGEPIGCASRLMCEGCPHPIELETEVMWESLNHGQYVEPRKLLVQPKPKDLYAGSPSCPWRLSFCSVQLIHDSVNMNEITFTELTLAQFHLWAPDGSLWGMICCGQRLPTGMLHLNKTLLQVDT